MIVSDLAVQGMSSRAIAPVVGANYATVTRDIKSVASATDAPRTVQSIAPVVGANFATVSRDLATPPVADATPASPASPAEPTFDPTPSWDVVNTDTGEVAEPAPQPRSITGMDGKADTEKRTMALSLNVDRRHLNREQKRALVAESVKADPDLTAREHARRTGVHHSTVGAIRDELVANGEISHSVERVTADGRPAPGIKPATKPAAPRALGDFLGVALRVPDRHGGVNIAVLDTRLDHLGSEAGQFVEGASGGWQMVGTATI